LVTDIPAGDGKIAKLFLQCRMHLNFGVTYSTRRLSPVLRIRIRDPRSSTFFTPGSGAWEIKILDPGSGMENPDPGSGIRDPVSGIKITDPQHLLIKGEKKHIHNSYNIQLSISFTSACETSNPKSLNFHPFTVAIYPSTGIHPKLVYQYYEGHCPCLRK
jgi:hypothetical protein